MVKCKSKISIFDYTDYRKYLSDFYLEQKRNSRAFSYRYFAQKAGFNSVGLYKDVIEGRQNLGRALIFKFSIAMGHGKKEAEYFENMVFFNESDTVEKRRLFFERMMDCQDSKANVVAITKYEFYQKWYYSAVRALVSLGKFRDEECDICKIAGILNPQIKPDEAKKALGVLERLGFIAKDNEGFFTTTHAVISSGVFKPDANVASLNIINFQKEVMGLANESLDRFGTEFINLSTLTIGISASTMAAIKGELAATRNKIAILAEKDNTADRVYQLNIQFFPLSDTYREVTDA